MEVFILKHETNWRHKNISVHSSLEKAKIALERELDKTISEPEGNVRIKIKTPENTSPWHWPSIVYAIDLNQFTAEAGDVPDWFVIQKLKVD